MRIKPIELPHLAVGAPAQITIPGVPEIGVGNALEAACRIEARGNLIGDGLVVHEAVRARRTDGLLVQPLGVEFPPLDPGHLRPDECRPVGKILRAMQRPGVELLQVFRQPRAMIFAVLKRGEFMDRRMAKRIVEVVLDDLQQRRGIPEHRFRPGGGLQGVRVFAREETRLQFADVVPTFGKRQRRIARQITLEISFAEYDLRRRSQDGRSVPAGCG